MGYHIHYSIICNSWKEEHFRKAHNKAVKIFGDLTSPIVDVKLNGYASFFIAPNGSKRGWPQANEWDNSRTEFKEWLRKANLFLDWVEVSFGGDEPDENTDIVSYGNYEEELEAPTGVGNG